MKCNGSIAIGPGPIGYVLSWIWIIVRIQKPDLTGLLNFSGIFEEVMDGI